MNNLKNIDHQFCCNDLMVCFLTNYVLNDIEKKFLNKKRKTK